MTPTFWIALALVGGGSVSAISAAAAIVAGVRSGGKVDATALVWVAFAAFLAAAYVAKLGLEAP